MIVTEYAWTCGLRADRADVLCGCSESWTTELSADVSAAQHVRDAHPALWRKVGLSLVDDKWDLRQHRWWHHLPSGEPAETFGRRFEDWESQL